MSFEKLMREWLSVLEGEYGVDAEASPISEARLQELREYARGPLPEQYEAMLRIGDGFFVSTVGDLFPDGQTRQLSSLTLYRDPGAEVGDWPFLDLPYINSGPLDWNRLLLIAEGSDGRDLAVVAGGAAHGAVVAINFDRFEWVARSLEDLIVNCLWYYESGLFRFNPKVPTAFRIIDDAREPHPKLAPWTWTCMPYERDYDGDAPIGAWRWPT